MQKIQTWVNYLAALGLCLFCTSCGYTMGQGGILSPYQTISVPYVVGDKEGELTADIIEQITISGQFRYECNGELILLVTLLDVDDENIGYRYDKKNRKRKNEIVPTETRFIGIVEVTVIERASGCTLVGPVRLSADVEFDHDYYSSSVNVFSLGQVSDIDEGYDAAYTPLNRYLAMKIVNFISSCW